MQQEHKFAPLIRTLGKGKSGSRDLTTEESRSAMEQILANEVEPVQLGAFLMLLRYKEESPEEIAGFVQAVTNCQPQFKHTSVDLDWSSYAGKKRQLPWFILSALLLSQNGIKLFMHGAGGHTPERIYTEDTLRALGIPVCSSLDQAADEIATNNFAYLPLAKLSPKLEEIIQMRPLLGLRSPVHTLARMLNPFSAPYMLQSIFHPGYQSVHLEAGRILQQPHMAVIKGDGGEIERNPDLEVTISSLHDGKSSDLEWQPLFKKRHVKDERMDVADLRKLWCGEIEQEYGEAAVISTAAVALVLMGKADNQQQALQQATAMWQQRDTKELPLT